MSFREGQLAGLAVMETLRLTWNRVDLNRGLVEISGEVKNEYRNRVIPVCDRVRDALARASASASGPFGAVVRSPSGASYTESKVT